jgi:single-stranded-DNA-specific exonuclease
MKRYVHRDEIDTSLFFGDVDIHPLTLLLLAHRGVQDRESADVFLNPSYERDIGDPLLIHGMKQAVARIIQAIQSGENIALYTDYDCDGIPGGVVLRDFFTTIGYPVEVYIPHRHKEGYGLHEHAIDALCEKGVKLIITVDLAITDIDEVAYAKKKGIDCIVTDHHLPIHNPTLHAGNTASYAGHGKVVGTQVVPDAVAVVNSKQDVCLYEDDMLCGCAVAWKLVCALISTLKEETGDASESLRKVVGAVKALPVGYEKWLLDLVGISTISDMVPLQKENRALAYFGLKVLQKTKRTGRGRCWRGRIEA